MARWFGAKQKLPPNVVQLSDAPVDEFGEPNWNGEIEAKTRELGSDFLAAFLSRFLQGCASADTLQERSIKARCGITMPLLSL